MDAELAKTAAISSLLTIGIVSFFHAASCVAAPTTQNTPGVLFTIQRDGGRLRATIKNTSKDTAIYSTYPLDWSVMVYGWNGAMLSNAKHWYGAPSEAAETQANIRVLAPNEEQTFLLSAHRWGEPLHLNSVVGEVVVTYRRTGDPYSDELIPKIPNSFVVKSLQSRRRLP